MVSWALKTKIVWKHYSPENLLYWLTTLGPTRILVFHLLGICLWFISLYVWCEKAFYPLCFWNLQMGATDTSLLRSKLSPFKQVYVILQFYSSIIFPFCNRNWVILSLSFCHISMFYFILTYVQITKSMWTIWSSLCGMASLCTPIGCSIDSSSISSYS